MMNSPQKETAEAALAAPLEIAFDGRRYLYRQYHYDRFEDAVNYARIDRGRPGFVTDEKFVPSWSEPFQPTEADLQLMQPYGITYAGGHFMYGSFRYDRLSDAIAYARHVANPR